MDKTTIKEDAKRLVERLPDDSTWEDLMQQILIRQAIEAGLEDSTAGRTHSVTDVRKRFGLSP